MRAAAGQGGVQEAPSIVGEVVASPGQPLDASTRAFFESRFGRHFGNVRVHTDARAADSADAVNALAYTVGRNVVFGRSQFTPDSTTGQRLIAHELVHVLQQDPLAAGAQRTEARVQRQEKDEGDPPDCKMSAGLGGFVFTPVANAKFHAGPKYPQLLAIVLKKLLGDGYTQAFRDQVMKNWGSTPVFNQGERGEGEFTPEEIEGPSVKEGESIDPITWEPIGLRSLLGLCARLGKPVTLSPEHQRLLKLGETAKTVFAQLSFPAWFTQQIFIAIMASRARLLSDAAEAIDQGSDPSDSSSAAGARVQAIQSSLAVSVYAVDAIRLDSTLVKHSIYQRLWPPPAQKGTAAAGAAIAPENRQPTILLAAGLIAYADARPRLALAALNDSVARKQLVDAYMAASGFIQRFDPSKGDQKLSDYPTQYTAPPYPSTLSVYPTLEASLYGSTRPVYGFTMALEFPNLFAAFQSHEYAFTAYHVPDDKLVNAAQATTGTGAAPSHWELLKTRLALDEKYREADIRAYANNLWDQIGPPGKAADLVNLNAVMRSFGTVIGGLIETVADLSWVARFNFQDEGLYIVRSVARWDVGEDVVLRRPPSVAYVPIFARDPELLAELRLQAQIDEKEDARKRLPKVIEAIGKTTDTKRLAELTDERARLEALLGGVEGMLAYQQTLVGKSTDKDAAARAEHLKETLETRALRGFGKGSERLPAVYVNDAGQMIDLLLELEVISEDRSTGTGQYVVNDATSHLSKSAEGSGLRHDAIVQALDRLFKKSDYGRGKASVRVDGTLVSIDVPTVSAGKLFMEAASNVATVLTIIAIAAAPFTAGASMALMVPAMMIGAVPSAYNIIERGIDHTFHFDLALAMDVVNIVGALVGAGAETRAGMQAIRLGTAGGRVLIVTGLGVMGASVLLMSEGVLDQIDALKDRPEGLRGAEVAKILGHFMLNAGILVGGLLAARARARGELGPRTFEEWFQQLDEPTRERIEKSKAEGEPARNFWKIYSEMDPLVRELLTQCGSDCVPMDPPPSAENLARIKGLAEGQNPGALRTLKGLLHENRTPVAMDVLLTALEEARNKAPNSKGSAKKIEAVTKELAARGSAADYILAEFSEGPVEALDKNNPGKWKRVRELANEIAAAGKISIEVLAKILDRVRITEDADPEEILGFLKKLSGLVGKVDGVEKMLGADGLGGPFTKFKGARWTLRFLEEAKLWDKVKAFEEPLTGGMIERVVDVRLTDGTRIEMKSWKSWHELAEVGFSRQIMADWLPTGGFRDPLIWAFEPGEGIGDAKAVIEKMNAALDKALAEKWRGYEDAFAGRRVDAIKAKLPEIVRVGAK